MKQSIRPYDLVGRWGGEEFMMVLPETTLEQAADIAERVRNQVQATPIALPGGKSLAITASLGVSQSTPGMVEPLDRLLNKADEALYRAKHSGRNQVCLQGE